MAEQLWCRCWRHSVLNPGWMKLISEIFHDHCHGDGTMTPATLRRGAFVKCYWKPGKKKLKFMSNNNETISTKEEQTCVSSILNDLIHSCVLCLMQTYPSFHPAMVRTKNVVISTYNIYIYIYFDRT